MQRCIKVKVGVIMIEELRVGVTVGIIEIVGAARA